MDPVIIHEGTRRTFTADPETAEHAAAAIEGGVANWTSSNPTVGQLHPAGTEDPTAAGSDAVAGHEVEVWVPVGATGGAPVAFSLGLSGDADLGPGVDTLTNSIAIVAVPAAATELDVVVSDERPLPVATA